MLSKKRNPLPAKRSQEDVVVLDDEDRPAKKVAIATQPPRMVLLS